MSDAHLLKLLEAHGHQFVESFGSSVAIGKRKEDASEHCGRSAKKQRLEEDSEEEWTGIGHDLATRSDDDIDDQSWTDDDEGSEARDDADGVAEDDDFTYETQSHQPDVIVFSEASMSSSILRGSKPAFMSSRIAKVTQETQRPQKKASSDNKDDDDLTNAQNDALLHRLVHTQLLSGSLNPELNLTPAQRKKALAGRIMEAAGKAKLGKGETAVRLAEHNRAAKHVRDGLSEKRKERQKKELEEAKQLGNYHPTLKSLYEASSTSKSQHRKRERGMKMGVGSFKGGILRLSKNDVTAVEGKIGASRRKGASRRGGKQ